jgi:hypothetical protein
VELKIIHSKIIEKQNTKKFRNKLLDYLSKNKCCNDINCNHPKYQTNAILHKTFKIFNKSVKEELNLNISQLWLFYVPKNEKTLNTMHTHKNLTCVLPLTEGDLGTMFKSCTINIKKNHWCVFDGNILHSPQPGICNTDRFMIAGDLY